ncbi:MAG: 4Fe-4S ferredoxin [Candidatus Adiutrix sp.]|jgi:ferredoxin|nr:4Fe-4S ferredoxin [Candidatus Adiutrix sp.]
MTVQAMQPNELVERDIIEIDEDLCDGCGLCLNGCAEGALTLAGGKAKLVGDIYCDGLGSCLGRCPAGALKVIRRRASLFDEEAAGRKAGPAPPRSCADSRPATLESSKAALGAAVAAPALISWPIQLKLMPPEAPFLDSAVVTLASDCSAFAGPAFHETFLASGHPLMIACPKLDPVEPYIDKMAAILKAHPAINEIRVPMMSVPCCGGLGHIAAQAVRRAEREGRTALRTWIITPQGEINEERFR